MVSSAFEPGWPSVRSSSRTTRPTALTSTWTAPARPRRSSSSERSTPFLPKRMVASCSDGIVAAGEVLVGDAAGVADDVAHQLALGIVARLAEIDEHAGQVGRVELQPRHLLPAEILAHHDRLGVAAAPQLAQQAVLLGLARG